MPVYITDEPLNAVVRGTGKALEDLEKLKNVLSNSKKVNLEKRKKNILIKQVLS